MSDPVKHRCEALVVRYAPDPAAGEMLNIGVVLVVPARRYTCARFLDDWARISAAFPEADLVHLRRVASTVRAACDAMSGRPALAQDVSRLVDSIIAPDDASIVRSPVLSGITADPGRTLDELFARYVTARESVERRSRTNEDVWRSLARPLEARGVLDRVQPRILKGKHYELEFDGAWRNRGLHVAKSVSLDLVDPHEITTKAAAWMGRIRFVEPEAQGAAVHLLVGVPPPSAPSNVREAAQHGLAILGEKLDASGVDVVLEEKADELAERIANDLASPDHA